MPIGVSKSKIKRQIKDNLPSICKITSQYGIFTIEILPPDFNTTPHRIQTDDINLSFSNFCRIYQKTYNTTIHYEQTQYSQMKIFQSNLINLTYYIQIKYFMYLHQKHRHIALRTERNLFSRLNSIHEKLTDRNFT